MAVTFGSLILADTDYIYNATQGQRVIYDAVSEHLALHNAAMRAAVSMFVEETTEDFQRRYRLPGGGRLQRRGSQSSVAPVKNYGSWDVAFPLEDFGAGLAEDDVTLAYMTAADMQRHIDTILTQDRNTVRFEILRALFNSTARTFVDETRATLTIQPMANGDSVLYPPVIGSDSEATENHYLTSGYAGASISDTNDPIAGIAIPELEEHFGKVTGNSPIVVLCHSDNTAKLANLTAMVDVPDNWVDPGALSATPRGLPPIPGSARVVGRHTRGAWLAEWDYMPTGYLLAIHLEAPRPLAERVDPAVTGLPRGLTLVARDAEFPFERAFWRHRFGYGVQNRINGVAIELTTDNSYDTPAAYA